MKNPLAQLSAVLVVCCIGVSAGPAQGAAADQDAYQAISKLMHLVGDIDPQYDQYFDAARGLHDLGAPYISGKFSDEFDQEVAIMHTLDSVNGKLKLALIQERLLFDGGSASPDAAAKSRQNLEYLRAGLQSIASQMDGIKVERSQFTTDLAQAVTAASHDFPARQQEFSKDQLEVSTGTADAILAQYQAIVASAIAALPAP